MGFGGRLKKKLFILMDIFSSIFIKKPIKLLIVGILYLIIIIMVKLIEHVLGTIPSPLHVVVIHSQSSHIRSRLLLFSFVQEKNCNLGN